MDPPDRHEPEVHVEAAEAPAARSRVRQALVCPYCRDEVQRRGTVACARRRRGALYHRECWEECATQYGGCAVYGCESRKSREITALGYFWRLLRLFLAALLFPPRFARAIKRHHDDGPASIFRVALARARETRQWFKAKNLWPVVVIFVGIPLAMGLIAGGLWLLDAVLSSREPRSSGALFALILFLLTVGPFVAAFTTAIWVPPLVAFFLTLGFYAAKVLALALRSELAGLTRADEGGGTVLGRLRAGGGGKKDCH